MVDSTRVLSASLLRFDLRQTSGTPVEDWKLELRSGSASLRNVVGASSLLRTLDVEPTDEEIAAMIRGGAVSFRLQGENREGIVGEASGSIPVEVIYRREESPMEESAGSISTPILFGYNSAELTPEAIEALEGLRRRIPTGFTLRIIGYADDLGGSEYNRALSRRRAEAVAARFPDADTTIVAAGEVNAASIDATPEGRYYARTVRIRIEN